MLIVKCIKDNWTVSKPVKKLVKLGEKLPEIGKTYHVIGYVKIEDVSEYMKLKPGDPKNYDGYLLEEYSSWPEELGIKIAFKLENFEIIKEQFTPNTYYNEIGAVESIEMIYQFKL